MAANYTQTEVLNAVARVFRARIDSSRTAGIRNNSEEYLQLMDLASVSFLLYPDAIFYVGQLACNTLLNSVSREIDIVEDMLVALEYMERVGRPVRDSATLHNARTALLDLDAVGVVTNRPETKRFSVSMERYAKLLSHNVVDARGTVARTREESRGILSSNFTNLKYVHLQVVESSKLLRDLLSSFISLSIPTKAATTAFASIQKILDDLIARTEASDVENLTKSRNDMLLVLTSKSAVDTISTFLNPGELKYRSPLNPIPSNVAHQGRVTGTGTPASLLSGLGPWPLPISAPLSIKVNSGSAQSVPVDQLNVATMPGRNEEPFNLSSVQRLHVVVDPAQRAGTVKIGSTTTTVLLNEVIPLLFKHLGAAVAVTPLIVADTSNDAYLRAITGFPLLQTFGQSTWNSATSQLTLTNITINEDSVSGFRAGHVGYFVSDDLGQRFEILSVDDLSNPTPSTITIDPRGLTPSWGTAPTPHAFQLYGQPIGTTQTKFTVAPAFSQNRASGQNVTIGPTMKTVKLTTSSSMTVDQIIASIQAEVSDADPANVGAALNWHVMAMKDPANPKRLALVPRSLADPYVSISALFVKPLVTAPGLAGFIYGSCNDVLGMDLGLVLNTGFDTTRIMTATELAAMINQNVSGVSAAVEKSLLFSGATLSTNYGQRTVQATGVDWEALGVQVGHILEIMNGRASGTYQISGVTTSTLSITRTNTFPSSETNLSFRVYGLRAKVSSVSAAANCALEISGAPELGFAADKVYGSIPQFEAVNKAGDLLSFDRAAVGDTLRLAGSRTTYEIVRVNGTQLVVASPGLPSNTDSAGFEVIGAAAASYATLSSDLATFLSSAALLKKNHFDQSLDDLDAALTSVVTPGQNFGFSRNRIRQLLADLLSLLTSNPRRSSEYGVVIPTQDMNLESILSQYQVPVVLAVESLVDAFVERKYDRAVDLLRIADILSFYKTDEETASYSGNVLSNMRKVNRDLPDTSTVGADVERNLHVATGQRMVPDAETNFSDLDGEFSVDD